MLIREVRRSPAPQSDVSLTELGGGERWLEVPSLGAASEKSSPHRIPRLDYRIKLLYGIGDVANAVKLIIFGLYTLFFATTVMGLPGMWIGIVGFIALVWDAVIDPYIGFLSDKARFRFGRRHIAVPTRLLYSFRVS